MINALKTRIKESERPVGTKRPSLIKCPPEGHVYGLEGIRDPEGVGTSNFIFYLIYFFINYYSYSYT
jgi:hypothetical protein